ncbi:MULTISPECIES: Asp-tRNA(Asn)/Glu-tRNA(Gln) amidotransferase subunit GatA [Asticcacaulis]|uniref:Asp-tRNA(Asn)/Glu-tRNA(Gln) amidotransferase subunit GatA n=1 Tax=Asticcacaulis TaxID=76890 RepID=UPI001AEB1D95|nr:MULTISPECIES: Asp-tRNA(Asn)/Glu-tRNA(Gln) amidotransferase subunit GatA [Asticcacaulis]MBP2161672.1 aspartyl-tRNA(Asn)/glutamyl-tRNA(Gln) amidotransferase subunit A [Asticcacaulis solisilvae]MDR6802703.1 aspartyl-tRNA(Asn)/glutamyl-tRNA(Gln) amidotransferase subunit A [Asticcacaulis sp. BE141]
MSDLTKMTLKAAVDGLKAKQFSSAELTDAFIGAIETANPALNAYVELTFDKARQQAAASDAKLARGEGGALEGAPLGIKDLYCTEGVRTTACSGILANFVPTYESTVTANLWRDGAVMLGKLNMDEFAMGSSNETSYWGAVTNPWKSRGSNAALTPGGSSGGSASAVAADLCLAATASDTGGSIRQPAAFTGTVGIKPTYGRCSRYGMVAFASSLDQAGPITKTVEDSALMLQSMCSHDAKDSTSLDVPVPDFSSFLGQSLKGLRVGIPDEYRLDGIPAEIDALWEQGIAWLKDAGAEIVRISLPHTKYALPCYYIIAPAEASSNLARYDGMRFGHRTDKAQSLTDVYELSRSEGFGKEVKRRIMIGTYVLSAGFYDAYYVKALKVRRRIAEDFTNAWNSCDVILTPATPSAAFQLGDAQKAADPVAMYLNDVFTVTTNLAGLPGMSVPAGLDSSGLPLGLQVIGKALDEGSVLKAGYALEKAAGFTARPDRWW